MRSVGVIAEGYTDQLVIRQVLLGAFALEEDEPDINFVQPLEAAPDASGSYAPGGWSVLFKYLRSDELRRAVQFNELVVVHVDTDVADHVGFDVSKRSDPGEMAEAVEARLIQEIGAESYAELADKVVFAVAVDEVECWLLPLLFTKAGKRSKTTGCLEAADHELGKQKRPRLKKGDGKDAKAYAALTRPYQKAKTLRRHKDQNPSLARFVDAIDAWRAAHPEASQPES